MSRRPGSPADEAHCTEAAAGHSLRFTEYLPALRAAREQAARPMTSAYRRYNLPRYVVWLAPPLAERSRIALQLSGLMSGVIKIGMEWPMGAATGTTKKNRSKLAVRLRKPLSCCL